MNTRPQRRISWTATKAFIVAFRSLSPMPWRQRWRFFLLYGKKVQQVGRPPNETELREILAEVLNESDLVLRSVGGLTIAWAETDMFLDYINGILSLNAALSGKRLPRTTAALEQKIEFLKDGFKLIPSLAILHDKTSEIITEFERLQPIRNDIVHGVASERAPVAVRKVIRLRVEGKFLSESYKTYTLVEIGRAAGDAVQLRNKLITLFADAFRILYPDLGTELPSRSS